MLNTPKRNANCVFTFCLFQLQRQHEPSVQKLPEIQREDHPVHHIVSHFPQHCMRSLKTTIHSMTHSPKDKKSSYISQDSYPSSNKQKVEKGQCFALIVYFLNIFCTMYINAALTLTAICNEIMLSF